MDFDELLTTSGVADLDAFKKGMKDNGIYLSKEDNIDLRYSKEKENHTATKNQLSALQKEYEEFKNSQPDNTAKVEALEKALKCEKIDSAVKIGLLKSSALDVDYLLYKLKEKGEITIDENGKINNFDALLEEAKTTYPSLFDSGKNSKEKKFKEKEKGEGDGENNSITKEQFDKLSYTARVQLKNENPELYDKLVGKN